MTPAQPKGFVLVAVTRVVILMWILALVVFFAGRWRMRTDLTSDGLYTLTASTKKVLAGLKDQVLIEAYMTPDEKLPEAVRDVRQLMKNCLDEYVQLGRGKVQVEYLDPQSDSTIKERAERLGIKGQQVQESGQRAFSILEIWQGMRIRYGGSKQKIVPFFGFSPATAYYEQLLTPPIKELSLETKPKVGILAFPSEAGGGGNPMMGQRGGSQPQRFDKIREVAKGRYELVDVDLNEGKLVPDEVKTMLVVRPKNLADRQKYAIDQFLMRGGKLVVFADTAEYEIGKQRAFTVSPVSYDAGDAKLKFVDMLAAYGVQTDDKLLADAIQDTHERFVILSQTMMGAVGQPIPYPYWFHALDLDWGEEKIARMLATDMQTGSVDDEKVKQMRTFKPGMNKDDSFLKALAKGLQGKGPGMFWPCRVELSVKDGKAILPDGVTGAVLMRSSPISLAEPPPQSTNPFGGAYVANARDRNQALNDFIRKINMRVMSENRQQFGLMVGLKGTFPSFFAGKELPPRKKPEAPKPDASDPLAEPIKKDPLAADSQPSSQPASQPASKPLEGPANPTAQEKKEDDKDKDPAFLAKADPSAQLIVIGDADFIRDDILMGEYAQEGGPVSGEVAARFFSGLLDSLSEDQDLVELTNKKATERLLSYTPAFARTAENIEEIARQEERTASRLRSAIILGPVVLVLFLWLMLALSRSSAKARFLASVGGR